MNVRVCVCVCVRVRVRVRARACAYAYVCVCVCTYTTNYCKRTREDASEKVGMQNKGVVLEQRLMGIQGPCWMESEVVRIQIACVCVCVCVWPLFDVVG